ncbi:hypothetical protein HMN09_00365000 [Mycena chlorophos]|uniref:MYND-type domain-containing protein n=1 Tax=Mycena chlorophos TaxID=658473 RepID=A0A8H6TIW8_MYCCL|nr:hypothetical protein HMN09_00365000 [Mycena chlorophos]
MPVRNPARPLPAERDRIRIHRQQDWDLLDASLIPPDSDDVFSPTWPHKAHVPAALRAVNTLLAARNAAALGEGKALWDRLLPWMLFFQRYHARGFLPPALTKAIPELNICLPFLHLTMEVFQPVHGADLTGLYKSTPGLARLLFHTWRLIVEDGGKTDELGYRALTVLLPREYTPEMAESAMEGAGGGLEGVTALIARHIEVFGPKISRRVDGPERLMSVGVHLGVFQTVLMTVDALSRFCVATHDEQALVGEHHIPPFIRQLAPALSVAALTRCIKQLAKIPPSIPPSASRSRQIQFDPIWDAAFYDTLALLASALMIDRTQTASALRHGLVPALARCTCSSRRLSARSRRKTTFFVAHILAPATMLRSLRRYHREDKAEVDRIVRDADDQEVDAEMRRVWAMWCDMRDRHLVMLSLRREREVCGYAQCKNTATHASTPLRRCSGCALRVYCSIACQKADWRTAHRGVCKAAQAQAKFTSPPPASALPRQQPSSSTREPPQAPAPAPLHTLFTPSDLHSLSLILLGHYLAHHEHYLALATAVQRKHAEPAVLVSDFADWQWDADADNVNSSPAGKPRVWAVPASDERVREMVVRDSVPVGDGAEICEWDAWVERAWRDRAGLQLHVLRVPVGGERGPEVRCVVCPMSMRV